MTFEKTWEAVEAAASGVALEDGKNNALKIGSGLQFTAGNAGRGWGAARLVTRWEQVGHLKANSSHYSSRRAPGEAMQQYPVIIALAKAQGRPLVLMRRAAGLVALTGFFHLVQAVQDVVDHGCTPVTRSSQDATASRSGSSRVKAQRLTI